jgi:hypothetical protein
MSILCRFRTAIVGGVVTALALVAGCASGGSHAGSQSAQRSGSATSAALRPPADRCGPPNAPSAHTAALRGPDGSTMPAVDLGRGSTIAVLLHQTDGDGLCGFWPYASWLVQRYPVRAALADLCSYGHSQCRHGAFYDNQLAQVALVVRWARGLGARRVVLVGASMGGALALAAATRTHADAVVDLSGPADWVDAEASSVAPRITVPILVAVSPNDPDASFADIKAAFALIPARTKKFVTGDGPHGWDLLGDYTTQPVTWHPLADTVGKWITGQYS